MKSLLMSLLLLGFLPSIGASQGICLKCSIGDDGICRIKIAEPGDLFTYRACGCGGTGCQCFNACPTDVIGEGFGYWWMRSQSNDKINNHHNYKFYEGDLSSQTTETKPSIVEIMLKQYSNKSNSKMTNIDNFPLILNRCYAESRSYASL